MLICGVKPILVDKVVLVVFVSVEFLSIWPVRFLFVIAFHTFHTFQILFSYFIYYYFLMFFFIFQGFIFYGTHNHSV